MHRTFDLLLAILLILLTLPLQLLITILLLIFSPGNPIFLHERAGRFAQPFRLIKFRSMKTSGHGDELTIAGDKRITTIGQFLRRFKLDELPQLINVVRGEMSFVGPRPESTRFVYQYTEEQKQIFQYRPGLTDPASLKYRHEEGLLAETDDPIAFYLREILPDKIKLSLKYQQNRNLFSDLNIICRTVLSILMG